MDKRINYEMPPPQPLNAPADVQSSMHRIKMMMDDGWLKDDRVLRYDIYNMMCELDRLEKISEAFSDKQEESRSL